MKAKMIKNSIIYRQCLFLGKFLAFILMVMTLTLMTMGYNTAAAQVADDEDVEILASGPIHEAFAEAVILDPEPGPLIAKNPPKLIEEIPPSQKPEGDVQWIPGYWAWDDDRNDFIWVSGIWRVPPPDRQWIPGYWNRAPNGYQWVSGYWASDRESETYYLPEPPESVEVGPNSNAPSPNHTWIAGCWVWHNGRYAWRTGYWAPVHPDWVWVPGHYVWSPRGYIYVSGYWDFVVVHRGILFAPIFFPTHVNIGWVVPFSPSFVVHLSIFDSALFLRPSYHHYYFGDYYAHRHYKRGIYPWFSLHARRVAYNPIYAHQHWRHRNDHQWERQLEKEFSMRRGNENLRPAQRYDHHSKPQMDNRPTGHKRPTFVAPFSQATRASNSGPRFRPLSETERKNFVRREKEVVHYSTERQRRETVKRPAPEETKVEERMPRVEKMPQSPIKSRPGGNSRYQKPPSRQREPKPNPNIEPLERKLRSYSSKASTPERNNRNSYGNARQQRPSDSGQRPGNGNSKKNGTSRQYEDNRQFGNKSPRGWNPR